MKYEDPTKLGEKDSFNIKSDKDDKSELLYLPLYAKIFNKFWLQCIMNGYFLEKVKKTFGNREYKKFFFF